MRFFTPQSGRAILSIYNQLGQRVTCLLNQDINQGHHQIVWDAKQYPNGLYFCRLKFEEYIETKKLLLLK